VLSVLAHPDLDVAETAMEAIGPLPSSQSELYSDIILASVPEAVRKLLEARFMQGYQLQSEFARRQINEASEAAREAGRAEGREAGRVEGREAGRVEGREAGRVEGREAGRVEGREAGRVEGLRSAVLTLARSRFDAVTDDDVAALAKLRDEDMLNELIVALGRPGTATEARAMFERVLRRGE
jgi:predicted transposase YdaD